MKIDDFPIVEALINTRNHIIGQRDGRAFRVTIEGRPDAEMVERVRHLIIAELDRRILDIEQQLKAHGVSIT